MGLLSTPIGLGAKAVRGLMDMSTPARMARAKEQGFDVNTPYFHGSQDGRFQEFNKSGHGELGKGVYLSKEYKIADDYSRPQYGAYRPEHGDVKSLLVKGDMAEIDRQEYLDLRSKYMNKLQADNGGEWKGEFYNKAVDMVEDYYKKQGYVGLSLRNPTLEQSHMYDQSVVFDTSNIRSPDAAFDPAKTGSSNLLASNSVATTSAASMANVTGQPSNLSSYMQGNTDAYLTNEERQYLQNKQAFESNFSDDTGWDRADILPFRVNEQTGEREFATPEMIKGLISGLYDIGQSKNTKISNPASLLELI